MFPITSTEKSKVGLDAAEQGIINFSSSELTYFTVSFNETEINKNNRGCFKFNPEIDITNITVLDENDIRVNATWKNKKIIVNGTKGFYQFYSSPEFTEAEFEYSGCDEITEKDFKIGLIRKYEVLSYNKIKNLNDSYSSSYNNLKINFNIPKRENFGFILRWVDGKEIFSAMKNKPERGEILARDTPVQMIYSNGTSRYGILHIETW